MRIVSRILFVLFVLIGVLVAVSNRQAVELALWPLPHIVLLPLYVLVMGVLLLGVLAGLGLGWWAGRHHRRRAREHGRLAARLEREVERLRETASGHEHHVVAAVADAGFASYHDQLAQRSLERQRALVAPELTHPGKRSRPS